MIICWWTQEGKALVSLLRRVNLTSKNVWGSAGYKLCRWNEIRALIRKFSTPMLFLTLNPHDISLSVITGCAEIHHSVWEAMTTYERATFTAKHPDVAAHVRFADSHVHRRCYLLQSRKWFVRGLGCVLWDGWGTRKRDFALSYACLVDWQFVSTVIVRPDFVWSCLQRKAVFLVGGYHPLWITGYASACLRNKRFIATYVRRERMWFSSGEKSTGSRNRTSLFSYRVSSVCEQIGDWMQLARS